MQMKLTHDQVGGLVGRLSVALNTYANQQLINVLRAYPVPRGGVPVAYALQSLVPMVFVENPAEADVFIDDLIDSGSTCERYCDEYPGKPFFALLDKRTDEQFKDQWIVFPWEVTDDGADAILTAGSWHLGIIPRRSRKTKS